MLSDERIRQIADDIYCSEGTHAEIEHSIRAALAEAAVCSQFKPGESGQVWEAAQVPVVERNQCDGCNRGLQVCDDGLHREPSGHPVMACTRNKYTRSIPATELERLRKDAERMQKALSDIAEWTDRYTTPGHPISNIARAAITKERQS